MPKKKTMPPAEPPKGERILTKAMEDVMHDSMIPYAEYVILDRALPRVEDGLKPVQRRILYTMNELTLWPDKPHRKCARIVGDCLGKYHPHGDSSIYDALVRLAQDFTMRMPLVDGHGNFGSIDGDSAAAMRYTEAKMRPLALEMLRDIDKETVPFSLNFDDTLKEPDLLPASFPNLLVNGASGIAVGLATNIPPHNLGEVIDSVLAQIDDPNITTDELMKFVKGPDFPTGGEIIESDELKKAYETGRAKLLVRAKCHIEQGTAGKSVIVMTEVPYQVSKAALLEKIAKLQIEKKGPMGAVSLVRDESDREGIRAIIEVRKDADPQKILAYLYKYTPLQTTFGVNIVAIAEGKPRQMGLKEINSYYIGHRRNVVRKRTEFDLEKARAREHILEGLIIAINNIDEVIAIIKASENPAAARENLIKRFDLSQIQAQAILDMRLQRLTALQIEELRREYEEIEKLIAELESILKSDKKLMNVIKKELRTIRDMYADERRTKFVDASGEPTVDMSEFKVTEDATVTVTAGGYARRFSGQAALTKAKANPDIREADTVKMAARSTTDGRLMFITTLGRCFRVDVADIPDGSKARERGKLVGTLCGGFESGEEAIAMLPMPEASSEGELLIATANGMIKRTALSEYAVRSKAFAGINLKNGDRAIAAMIDPKAEGETLLLITSCGMSINIDPTGVSAMGRSTAGVKGIAVDAGDEVMFAGFMTGEGEIALVTDRGYAKRMLVADFELQNRGGKGAKTFPFKKGAVPGERLACAIHITEPTELVIVRKRSEEKRISTESIPIQLRTSKGTPVVMALMDDTVTRVY